MRTPFPHQIRGSDYGVSHNGACYWMHMRTGKTLTTLLALVKLDKWPVLVIAPKSVMPVWEDEFLLMGADPSMIQVVDGAPSKRARMVSDPKSVTIVNFEMLQPYDVLNSFPWEAIVVDESIKIGNITTKRTNYMLDYVQKDKFPQGQARFCLSGSPASESPFQLIPQMFFVLGNFMGYAKWDEYIRENWKYVPEAYAWKPINGKRHLNEIRDWNRANSFQCTMADIGIELEFIRRRIHFPMSKWQENMLAKIREDVNYVNRTSGEVMTYQAVVRASHEMQVCCGLDPHTKKIIDTRAVEWVFDRYRDTDGDPILVVSGLVDGVVEAFKEASRKSKIPMGFMLGSQHQSFEDNEKAKQDFRSGKTKILFGQVLVVKMGHDFSVASSIYFFNNTFSNDDRTQTEMRCTRMDKKAPTEIIDAVVPGTFSDAAVDLLENKQDISSEYIDRFYQKRKK